jgi:tetratricopeptide (TPR) repeat protein
MKKSLTLLALLYTCTISAQPNCEAYKYYGDELKYKACKVSEKRAGHYQFSREYQEALDEAIAIDSTFSHAYRDKSTAYLKSGDFITWKALMDQAVRFAPEEHLDYRGWCRYQFFRDYEGAISDIEWLDSLIDYNIGYSVNGDYHLHIARALCYKAIGQPQKAIEIIEQQLQDSTYHPGVYDYLHLGVLHLEMGNYPAAIEWLKKQQEENDLAENRFYIALVYKKIGSMQDYRAQLDIALQHYQSAARMHDPYTAPMDKVYLEDIKKEIADAEANGH